ncbi:MAG: NADH-quinone oxidoreductase subunit NuoE [Ignavibacteria bacterium]|nr:NADH-quinone oxidoreductase subunit NuoE [Ignavibacteria bacterium]
MIFPDKNVLVNEVDTLVRKYGNGRESLLPILQDIQRKFGFISDFAMQEVAHQLNIHPVEVYGVVTFYSFLSTEPKGKYVIRLCKTISCELAGKDAVANTLERELNLKFGETSMDRKFTLEYCHCIGMCDQGPAMLINESVYTKLTPSKVIEIIESLK